MKTISEILHQNNEVQINESINEILELSQYISLLAVELLVWIVLSKDDPSKISYEKRLKDGSVIDKTSINPITWIRNFLKIYQTNKEFSKICNKLAKDPEVQERLTKFPNKKGWRVFIDSKLSEDEHKYLYNITKNEVAKKMN